MDVKINKKTILYRELDDFLGRPACSELRRRDTDEPVHIYGKYDLGFIDDLYRLQNIRGFAHVLMLFESTEVERVLKHINIFDGFSFSLVPLVIERDVYEGIFNFFLHSPMSVTYITWISSLMLRPVAPFEISLNGASVNYAPCPESCPLRARNCSKGFLFAGIYHPLKCIPNDEEVDRFCLIQLEYSERIFREVEAISPSEMEVFKKTRESLGIRSQFWIDPYGIYMSSIGDGND
jgi:hypothetical protein